MDVPGCNIATFCQPKGYRNEENAMAALDLSSRVFYHFARKF